MKHNLCIILDAAHGRDVKGKRSPDGKHYEWYWSRCRVRSLTKKLMAEGYDVYLTNPYEEETGLSERKKRAENIQPGRPKLLLSLHNDAAGSDGKWHNASGYSVYTTKGVTASDRCADIILRWLEQEFPEIKKREYRPVSPDRDFEENFTVLMGKGYMAVLLEWLFQDNASDAALLEDENVNFRLENALIRSISEIAHEYE